VVGWVAEKSREFFEVRQNHAFETDKKNKKQLNENTHKYKK